MARSPRVRNAAGTRNWLGVLRAGFRSPRAAAGRADIAAIDRGEGRRVGCFFRGLYPPHPARFRTRKLDLTSGAVVLRPFWFSLDRRTTWITETVTATYTRPRDVATDRQIKSSGSYRAGQPLEFAGFTVVVCETVRGRLEFAVPNPDVTLVLHYFQRRIEDSARG